MRFLAIILGFVAFSALAGEWGEIKSSNTGGSVDVISPEKQLGLLWPRAIVPGEELLMLKATYSRYDTTYYRQYRFIGVRGGSLQIDSQGGKSVKGSSAPTDPSMKDTLFIERASDGAFYFVPPDMKGEGRFKIEASTAEPGSYTVSIERTR